MRRRMNVLLLLISALIWQGAQPHLADNEPIARLEVIDVQPSPAGRLALDEPITFTFNRRVNCAEAQAALTWQPAIRGRLTCDEYALTFAPAGTYQRDANYSFLLSPPLRAQDGARMLDPYRVAFQSQGYLAVAEVYPQADSALVPVDSAITVAFDRPVVPLVMSTDMAELPHPLVLSPATDGAGEWVNSAVYVFTPSDPLQSATEYAVAVAGGLRAVDGSVLERAVTWSFKTKAPSIVSVYPRPTSRRSWGMRDELTLNPKIQVRFDQAMNRADLERAFFFRAGSESDVVDIAGAFEWAEDGKGFAFTPDVQLWYETEYEAGFPPGMTFSPSGYSWSYLTAPRPAIEWTSPSDGAIDVGSGGFSLKFASRMNIDTLKGRIQIEPAPDKLTRDYYSHMNDRYDLHFRAQPSTEYTVRVDAGMEDLYGNAIEDPLTFRFTTGPLPPRISLRVPGPVGMYNAYRQPTQLYIAHRGLNKVELDFYRIPTNEFIALQTGGSRRDSTDDKGAPGTLLRRWTIEADVAENITNYDLLQLGDNGPITADEREPLAPGLYFLEATAPELDERRRAQSHYLNVATAVLTLKHTDNRLTIWAVDIESGAPIVGERINVYDQLGEHIGDALTDERGIAETPVWYTHEIWSTGLIAVLDAAGHFGVANSNWSDGMRAWDFDIQSASYERDFETHLYTDRPVYRTGQPVYFRGIVRSKDDINYLAPTQEKFRVTLRHDGKVVQERVLTPSEFGSFHGKFDLKPSAALGRYRVAIEFPRTSGGYSSYGDSVQILVAEYRLPEYQVTLSAEQPEIVSGATATLELAGEYYFGGPVADAAAEYRAYEMPYRFNYTGDGYYDFSNRSRYHGWYERPERDDVIAEGSLRTDAAGVAQFELKSQLNDEPGSQRWRVEASIRDEAGQTITDSADLIVHRGLLYIGARPERYVGRVGQDSVINIIAVDWESQPIAAQNIDVQVVERRWTRRQTQDLDTGRISTSWDVEEIPLTNGAVATNAAGEARFVFRPPTGGSFNIIVSTRDELGNEISATTRAWVSSSSFVRWRHESDKKIELIADRNDYRVGDRAQILIASPFQGAAQALISIERGDVLSTELVTLESNSHIHEFEILPEYAPNIFVSVILIKPAGEHNAVADWRMGLIELPVNPERKTLNIEIVADPDRSQPGEEVTFRLRVTDWKGDPVAAEVGVGLTDLAALSLGERNSERLIDVFFRPQPLGVLSASSLVRNADEFTANLVKAMGTLEAMNDHYDCCFGGGGGGAPIDPTILEPRSEFIDTPYWNPTLITDENGEASFNVALPDNLTTWRLDARAITEGRAGQFLVGENTFDLISALPLLIRPQTPRFFTVGDRARLSAVVNNNSRADVAASVSIRNTSGLEFADPSRIAQRVLIPAGGRERVTWLMTILDVASVAPSFVVLSDDRQYSDASISPVSQDEDGTLPVFRYEARETVGTAGALLTGGSRVEAVLLPRDSEVRSGSLDILIDRSLAGVTNESLSYLARASRRHRECASAIVSRFLPNIVSYRALAELGLAKPDLKSKLDQLVSGGLRDLYAQQSAEGGWSWCSRQRAHASTTAYALIGLAEAKRLGYPVAPLVIQRAQRIVRSSLIAPTLQAETWSLNRQAFLLYALAASGAPDVARSNRLFERRARLNLDAVAFLAKTLVIINPEDLRLDALSQMLLNRAVTCASGTFFEETYGGSLELVIGHPLDGVGAGRLAQNPARKRAAAQCRPSPRQRSRRPRLLVFAPGKHLVHHRAHQLDEA